ncbi:hypothetical protein FB45DRAFT_39871 [Roridomyces roridus]|uniref:Fungal-type protein kinase domain-containing protein n=1 Tax=Roridomyces roridus TaxID=1738132 RepID=A0AAD7BR68_9AGAR|nr:hypothetical protein FB45DRAFT_39871 [Roridomyces roridus]
MATERSKSLRVSSAPAAFSRPPPTPPRSPTVVSSSGTPSRTVKLLKKEIGAYPKDVPTCDLLQLLFPEQCLPLSTSSLFEKLSAGDQPLYARGQWVDCPDLTKSSKGGDVEELLVQFLQNFGERVAQLTGADAPKRTWSAQYADNGVEDAPNVRKPDILLADHVERIRWRDAHVHGELKCSSSSKNQKAVFHQMLNGAYLIFASQDDRRFVVSLCFMAHTLQLYIFDRAGLVTSSSFDIHKEPKSFIHVITALMFADDRALLGYDTSIVKRDNLRFITVDATEYQIVRRLFISDVIRGRGTVCWHARHGNQDVVIKDSWADANTVPEADILKKAAGIKGVPQVLGETIVRIRGAEDTTATLRSVVEHAQVPKPSRAKQIAATLESTETRIHRRLVITPLCLSLPHFASRRELLSVFIDIVDTHRQLDENDIVHGDISINNLMIVPHSVTHVDGAVTVHPLSSDVATAGAADASAIATPVSPTGPRRALTIDFDYSRVKERETPVSTNKSPVGHRTGTVPFMAVEVLLRGDQLQAHEAKHDLESMLYVLIWLCLYYAGPGNIERQNFDIRHSPLVGWIEGSFISMGLAKSGTLRDAYGWQLCLDQFAPYFAPIKQCITEWKELFVKNKLKHEAVLKVLRDGLAALPEEESGRGMTIHRDMGR